MADSALNPFLDDIFDATIPDFSRGDVEWIHLSALAGLKQSAQSIADRQDFGSGKVALISAPRAGFGKSHLISRLTNLMGDGCLHLPLSFDPDADLTWSGLLGRTISDLHHATEPGAECTILDGIGRRVFASATRQMIAESKIPSADPEQAMAALDRDPVGLFDLGSGAQVVGHWFNQYFDQLQPTVAEILARRCGISSENASAWAKRFHTYASLSDEQSRIDTFQESLPKADEPASKQGLHEFLRFVTAPRPAILTTDDLDGFYRDPDAGQRLAHILLQVAKMSPRSLVVIAANEDLWEASFGLHIASAYEDRLTAQRIRLGGLDTVRGKQLVRDRILLAGHDRAEADSFDHYLALEDLFAVPTSSRIYSPRDILRYTATQWERFRTGKPSPRIAPQSEKPSAPKITGPPDLAPIPTPEKSGSDPAPEIAPKDSSPSGTEIFDKLTRDSISEAAKSLVGSKPPANPVAESDLDHPAEKPDPEEGTIQDIIPELVGHSQPAAPEPTGKNGNSGSLDAPDSTSQNAFSEEEDNPFQKLKQMLAKLRSEREEQRQTESRPEQETGRHKVAAETTTQPVEEEKPQTTATRDLPRDPDEPAILTDFHRERDFILRSGSTLPLIQPALCKLARTAGARFPVVTFDEPRIGGGETAVRWAFDDNEILFATHPTRDHAYWDNLGEFAKSRAADGVGKVKMIVFTSADEPIDVDSILGKTEDLLGIADFTILDRKSLASLYAAHRLMTGTTATAKSDASAHDAEDVLGKLAGELDFFWKRITRPLPGKKESGVAG